MVGETLDYKSELWNIFNHFVPTFNLKNRSPPFANNDNGEILPHLSNVRRDIDETRIRSGFYVNYHSLSRLRMKEGHHFPTCAIPSRSCMEHQRRKQNEIASIQDINSSIEGDSAVAIRMEFWRHHTTRSTGTNRHKMELEFHGKQSLLDVHNAVASMTRDQLGMSSMKYGTTAAATEQQLQGNTSGCESGRNTSSAFTPASSPPVYLANRGCFFIENIFYTANANSLEYCTNIIDWIHQGHDLIDTSLQNQENPKHIQHTKKNEGKSNSKSIYLPRADFFGITRQNLSIKKMTDVLLDQLPFRLGVRYMHVFNGDVEISVFFTDVRRICPTRPSDEGFLPSPSSYPIVLDKWCLFNQRLCEGCNTFPLHLTCFDDELLNGNDGTGLCIQCFRMIHYSKGKEGISSGKCGTKTRVNISGETTKSCSTEEQHLDNDDEYQLLYNNFSVYPRSYLEQWEISVGHDDKDEPFILPERHKVLLKKEFTQNITQQRKKCKISKKSQNLSSE